MKRPSPRRGGGSRIGSVAGTLAAGVPALISFTLASHCAVDRAPAGARLTPLGAGPTVVFDLQALPLPNIPQPNDVATFPDPTSRTGRRINVSTVSPTQMETFARQGFGEMEGWGTFAPITVGFQKEDGVNPTLPALDLADLRARMQNDGHDMTNDPVYVINLTTGVPVMLDMGDGNFSYTPRDLDLYFPNDPKIAQQNLLFETVEEGAGLTQSNYAPQLDLDFDGVLDHPDNLAPLPPGGIEGIDDLTGYYERETDTLILRPLLPMEEKTEYAVVVTDRLHGPSGHVAKSPFEYVNHPEQNADVARAVSILSDSSRTNYYGDIAGSGAQHIAFAWTFTTAPTYEDLRLLRDGLYGRGPFAYVGTRFPAKAEAIRAVGLATSPADEQIDLRTQAQCKPVLGQPYAVNVAASEETIDQIVQIVLKASFSLTPSQELFLENELQSIDHFVIGTFQAPYYLSADPTHESPDDWFHLDYTTGQGRVVSDTVPFFLAVPKATPGSAQPFPTVVWSHGTSLFSEESIVRVGFFAKQGMATMAIDMPGHGLYLSPSTQDVAQILLAGSCYVEWLNGLTASRAYDLNGDGVPDSGGYLWTSHVFHSRDSIRQSVLDQIQTTRIIHSFDGKNLSDQDFNGDGKPDLAGDFDGNGVPDIGGTQPMYAAGDSYGGVVAMIQGALDPYITAAAPISGGGGLTDIAAHSSLIPTAVLEQIISPLLIAVPAASRDASAQLPSSCQSGQTSLRFEVNDLFNTRELEIACLDPADFSPGMTVTAYNTRNDVTNCARVGAGGTLRIPVPGNVGDNVLVQVFKQTDAVESYGTCLLKPGALETAGKLVDTWEVGASTFTPVTTGGSCSSGNGCQQFRDTFYDVGSPLVLPQEGLGYSRQTPNFRRLLDITQAALDTADPVNFAPYYMMRPLIGIDGETLPPRGILVSSTVGDPYVPIAAGTAFARAAGAVPFLPPSAVQTMPEYADYATPSALNDTVGGIPNELLIANHVVEGIARLGRTHAGPNCGVNYLPSPDPSLQCGTVPAPDPTVCAQTLYDIDWASEGTNNDDAPHPQIPLRLARLTSVHAKDAPSLAQAWAPRLSVLAPNSPDTTQASAPVVALTNAYINPAGQHVFFINDPCRSFDDVTYYDTQLARFLASGGKDVYVLSHPQTHKCMATQSCPFLQ